ncbi:MAG: hypothetical protein MI921_25160 [Cytophagales bacterium]|nr:hypothetical protein [Cytophagales bacterium]
MPTRINGIPVYDDGLLTFSQIQSANSNTFPLFLIDRSPVDPIRPGQGFREK